MAAKRKALDAIRNTTAKPAFPNVRLSNYKACHRSADGFYTQWGTKVGTMTARRRNRGLVNPRKVWLSTLDAFRTFEANLRAGMLSPVPSRTYAMAGGAA